MIQGSTKLIRRFFLGSSCKCIFQKTEAPEIPDLETINLYIHIPFCKNLCPYCPYNKIPYDEQYVTPYINALKKEIALYYEKSGKISISSIYIGGGSPALLSDEVGEILDYLRERFIVSGDTCIELSPNDINDDTVKKLKDSHINLLSIGVQSFQNANLEFIGRNYKSDMLPHVIQTCLAAGFDSVNLDLMFALPGQSLENLQYDLDMALQSHVNQVTMYPLFTFPYSTIGTYLHLKHVKMPHLITRYKHYRRLHDHFIKNGFNRVSVWGFKKGDAPRYSSVTRDNYLGLGAGAGSHFPNGYFLNTFSVDAYIQRCFHNRFPTALSLSFTENANNYFWLYWRFYDTVIPKHELIERFGEHHRKNALLFFLMTHLGLVEINDDDKIRLNKYGAFWLHLAQNYFSLNYINKIWSVAMQEPFPESIEF